MSKNNLSVEDHVKVLMTILKMVEKDSAVVNREVFRAQITWYIKGVLLEVTGDKKE